MKPKALRHSRQSGFTLVEVAIALAIFVIGALAIIRIFPGALGVVQVSGERAAAATLNRAKLASYDNNPLSVPDAIYDTDTAFPPYTGARKVWSTVGTETRNNALPRFNRASGGDALTNYNTSALGHFRNIRGERVKAYPSPGLTMCQHPYSEFVYIYQIGEVRDVNIIKPSTTDPTEGNLDFSNARIVSNGRTLKVCDWTYAPTAPYCYTTGLNVGDTTFYVSYKYVSGGRIQVVTDEPIVFTSGSNPARLIQEQVAAGSVIPGSTTLKYRRLVNVYDDTNTENEITGNIVLPVGLFDSTNPPSPSDPDKVKEGDTIALDYVVPDWRWIVHDSAAVYDTATNANDLGILPIRHLDDTTNSPYVYALIWDGINHGTGSAAATGVATGVLNGADVRDGTVSFNLGSYESPKTRVVFKTLDNWAQQTSVAAASYLPYTSVSPVAPTSYAEDWRYFVQVGNSLYFKPSEAGKAVSVAYSYNTSSSGTVDTDVPVSGQIFTIDEDLVGAPSAASGIAVDGLVSELRLTRGDGKALQSSDVVTAIGAVKGVSIQVRTAWLNGDRYTQTDVMGARRPQ